MGMTTSSEIYFATFAVRGSVRFRVGLGFSCMGVSADQSRLIKPRATDWRYVTGFRLLKEDFLPSKFRPFNPIQSNPIKVNKGFRTVAAPDVNVKGDPPTHFYVQSSVLSKCLFLTIQDPPFVA
jgi:hypothetical protein